MIGDSGYKYIVINNGHYEFRFKGKYIKQSNDLEHIKLYRNEWLCKKFKLVDDYAGGV